MRGGASQKRDRMDSREEEAVEYQFRRQLQISQGIQTLNFSLTFRDTLKMKSFDNNVYSFRESIH